MMPAVLLLLLAALLPASNAGLVQYNATFNVTERFAPPNRFTTRTNGLCGQKCTNGPSRWYSAAFNNTLLVSWTRVPSTDSWAKAGVISTYRFTPSTGFQAVSTVRLDLCNIDMGSITTNANGSIIAALCIASNSTEWPGAVDLVETLRFSNCNFSTSLINTCYPIGWRNDPRNGAGRDYQVYLLEWTGGAITSTPNKVVKINRSAGGWAYGHWELSLNGNGTMYFVDMKVTANTHEGEVHFGISRTNGYTWVGGLSDGWACSGGHTIYNRMVRNSFYDSWSVMCGTDLYNEMVWHTIGENKVVSLGNFTGTSTFDRNGGAYNPISLGQDGWLLSGLGPVNAQAVTNGNMTNLRMGIRRVPRNVTMYNANPSAYQWVWLTTPAPLVDLTSARRVGNIQLHNFGLGGDASGRVLLGWSPTVRTQGLATEYVVSEIASNGSFVGSRLVLKAAAWGEDTLGAYMAGSGCVVYPYAWTGTPGASYPIAGSSYSAFSSLMQLTAVCPNDTTTVRGASPVTGSSSSSGSTSATVVSSSSFGLVGALVVVGAVGILFVLAGVFVVKRVNKGEKTLEMQLNQGLIPETGLARTSLLHDQQK